MSRSRAEPYNREKKKEENYNKNRGIVTGKIIMGESITGSSRIVLALFDRLGGRSASARLWGPGALNLTQQAEDLQLSQVRARRAKRAQEILLFKHPDVCTCYINIYYISILAIALQTRNYNIMIYIHPHPL